MADELDGASSASTENSEPLPRSRLERLLAETFTVLAPSSALGLLCTILGYQGRQAAIITVLSAFLVYVLRQADTIDARIPAHAVIALVLTLFLFTALVGDYAAKQVLGLAFRWSSVGATGIISFNPHANEFVATGLSERIRAAKDEVFIVGASFYITVVDRKDDILDALARGVTVRFLFYDPLSANLPEVAAGFFQTPDQLRRECSATADGLREIIEISKQRAVKGSLEVRLFQTYPRMRLYVFDRRNEEGYTYFVPHVDQQNSPNLPGYLARNMTGGVVAPYFDGLERLWNKAQRFEDWLPAYDTARAPTA